MEIISLFVKLDLRRIHCILLPVLPSLLSLLCMRSLLGTGGGRGGPGSLRGLSTGPTGSCCVVANIPVVLALSNDQFSQALAI